MLIKIEDVQVGDYVSAPLYLIENTRLPYQLFQVKRIAIEQDAKGTKHVLYDRTGKPLLMRSTGAFVQYRGKLRDGMTLYKTGDRLPAGDLRALVMNGVIDDGDMPPIHDVLTNFQFIEFDKSIIRYEKDNGYIFNYLTFFFLHLGVVGEVHIQLHDNKYNDTVMITYEAKSGERKGGFYHDTNDLRNLHLT